jgi:hypothetical protein
MIKLPEKDPKLIIYIMNPKIKQIAQPVILSFHVKLGKHESSSSLGLNKVSINFFINFN